MRNKLILIVTLISFGCKEILHNSGTDEINDFLTVIIEAKVEQDDIFEVYYSEQIGVPYDNNSKKSIFVSGSSHKQQLVFRLPDRIYPLKLRVDLGNRSNESPIEIYSITLSTGAKKIAFSISEIADSFRANQFLSHESGTYVFKRTKVNGVYDPFLLSRDLTQEIVEIFTP